MTKIEEIKATAKKLLEEGKVKYIIGYEQGTNGWLSNPVFIKKPEDVEKFVWDPSCVHNLAKFLVDEKRRKSREKQPDKRPVGIIVKGCDSRAVIVLLQEKFINREDVFLLGVSCEQGGVVDDKKLAKKLGKKKAEKIELGDKNNLIITTEEGKLEFPAAELLAERCLECKANVPLIFDVLVGTKPSGLRTSHLRAWRRSKSSHRKSAGISGGSRSKSASAATPAAPPARCATATNASSIPLTLPSHRILRPRKRP